MTEELRGFYVLVRAVIFIGLIPGAYTASFKRSICLEVVKDFMDNKKPCRIGPTDAEQWLSEKSGTAMCRSPIICKVSFWYNSNQDRFKQAYITIFNASNGRYLNGPIDFDCRSSNNKRTLSIDVYGGCYNNSWCDENEKCLMNNYGALGEIGTCVCKNDNFRINRVCRNVDVRIGEPCVFDFQCSKGGYNRVCDKVTSTCLCVEGFTEFKGYCLRTDLEVNQTCWYDEQCSGTANASVCRSNMCVCMDGHYFANGSCQPSINEFPTADTDTSKSTSQFQEHGDSIVAQNVAAVIGGFVLGILTCLAVVYVIHIRSRRRKHDRNTEAKFVNNISYEKDLPTNIQKDTKNLQQAKISHVKQIIKGDPKYSNTHQVKSETNDIYNHLNEKIEDDTLDVYDHAVTGASGMSNEEEYTHLSR